MNFTGYSFRNLLDLNSNDFVFKNLTVNESSYSSKLVVSGQNKSFLFSFSGNKILDNLGKFIGSFNYGAPFDLRFQFDGDTYQYFVNSELIGNGFRDDFKIEKLIIDTSGSGFSFEPSFSSAGIPLDLSVGSNFQAFSNLDFSLKNPSSAKVKIYSSEIQEYQNLNFTLTFETNQTGVLSGGQTLNFSSKDLSASHGSVDALGFSLKLNSNAGSFSFPLITNRIYENSSSFINYSYPSKDFTSNSFDGETGLNKFIFKRNEVSEIYSVKIEKRNLNGSILNSTGYLDFNIGGFSGVSTGLFISGLTFTNSGLYSGIPLVKFDYFSGVNSITVNEKNLISYGAGDSFDLVFSGNGTGVSATAFTKKEIINLFSGENPSHKFRAITGIVINSGGFGFNGIYNVSVPLSVVDYPKEYVDSIAISLGYSPLSFSTDFKLTAGNSHGRALLSSGNSGELSGVIIFGAGSGYDNYLQFPGVSFIRGDGDSFADNASGACILNSSGETVNFESGWEVLAGRTFSNLDSDYSLQLQTGVSGYRFGPVVFSSSDPYLYLKVKSKNLTSYIDSSLDFELYETGNLKQDFSIKRVNNYKVLTDPIIYKDTFPSNENIVEEE